MHDIKRPRGPVSPDLEVVPCPLDPFQSQQRLFWKRKDGFVATSSVGRLSTNIGVLSEPQRRFICFPTKTCRAFFPSDQTGSNTRRCRCVARSGIGPAHFLGYCVMVDLTSPSPDEADVASAVSSAAN